MLSNYDPELERRQLLDDFKIADAKYIDTKGKSNDARLERANFLLAMQETFPVTGIRGNRKTRAGFKEWATEKTGLTYTHITVEISYARDPAKSRQRSLNDPNKPFSRVMSAMKKGWPAFTDEQRQKIIDRVVEYAHGS